MEDIPEDNVRVDVRGGGRRRNVRQSARGNRSPSLLAAFAANVVCPIVMSADTNQIPSTANWAPLHNPRSKRRATQEANDSTSCKKMQKLGRVKMKRDRIIQEMNGSAEVNAQLKSMLRQVEKRISELQGAAVQRPTAKQVHTYYHTCSNTILFVC